MAQDIFETANVLVALGGDLNNTVPKSAVTACELAVLQAIHGNDAVLEIEPCGVLKRTMRVERARLDQDYSSDQKRRDGQCIVSKLYPGSAARLFQRLDELPLSSVQFKPGMAPEGIDEREEMELRAVQAGALLADGSVDDDALADMDAGDDDDDIRGEGASADAGALS